MAITVVNLATPSRDARILHSSSKGLKLIMGDLEGVVTDAAGKFTMTAAKLKAKDIKGIQGYGNAGGLDGTVFLAVDNLATNSFILTKADGTALASTDLTGKPVHFTAIAQ